MHFAGLIERVFQSLDVKAKVQTHDLIMVISCTIAKLLCPLDYGTCSVVVTEAESHTRLTVTKAWSVV